MPGSPGRGGQGTGTLSPAAEFCGAPPVEFYEKHFKNWGVEWKNHTEGTQGPSAPQKSLIRYRGPPHKEETKWGSVHQQNRAVFLDSSEIFPIRTENTNTRNHVSLRKSTVCTVPTVPRMAQHPKYLSFASTMRANNQQKNNQTSGQHQLDLPYFP